MKVEEIKEFKFIDGTFTPEEANSVLSSLIANKIHYHTVDDFSNHVRYARDSSHSKNRIEALKNTQEELKRFTDLAKEQGVNLVIKSNISLEYTK
ncbi:MAG: hypothetical protein H7199_00720 [Burkholderiales bacterium]|nr:hypothetical protein [Flavobacterium sp.]